MSTAWQEQQKSYWLQDSPPTHFPKLADDLVVDVAVIGGGIAGITTAFVLTQMGLRVALIEKNTIASGTTGGTTGKVSIQHGLFYTELIERFGKQKAQVYANAYKTALQDIKDIISTYNIDCSWTAQDSFVYTTDKHKVSAFKKEAHAASSLDLPASFETHVDLPFPTVGAVKFANQGYFNAAAYTKKLAQLINTGGNFVFEHTEAKEITDGKPCRIVTKHGSLTASQIVIATKVPPAPLAARFTYASLEHPHTSYIVAGQSSLRLSGMYISPDAEQYSILPVLDKGKNLILVGGQNHIPGLGIPHRRFQKLATYAAEKLDVTTIDYKWKAMDYMAYDKLPLVGPLHRWSRHILVVGGFKKWGLTTSMVAARIVQDYVTQQHTPQRKLFYPHRLSVSRAIPRAVVQEIKLLFK